MRFLRFRLRLVMVLRFVVVMVRRLVCRLSVMMMRWLVCRLTVMVVRGCRMMVVVMMVVIPIVLNQSIQHEFAGGKQQCNRCTQRNCQRLYFEYNRHFETLFFVASFAQNGAYDLGVGATHAVIHPGAFCRFGIEVGTVVDQPLYNCHMTEPAGVVQSC